MIVLPIAERHMDYAKSVAAEFDSKGFRIEIDSEQAPIGKKIRHATLQKIPYMIIIGDKEVQNNQISVRSREGKDLGPQTITEFIQTTNQVH
jgi:threonyl-tRNA synthetase